jgi:hypothetical protein
VTAVLDLPGLPALVSNTVAVAVAPRITLAPASAAASPVAPGSTLTVTCSPRARAGQRVQLLFGDRLLEPTAFTNPEPVDPNFPTMPTTFTFTVPDVDPGAHTVRLRVDGVDSLPVTFVGDGETPRFDPAQQVHVS